MKCRNQKKLLKKVRSLIYVNLALLPLIFLSIKDIKTSKKSEAASFEISELLSSSGFKTDKKSRTFLDKIPEKAVYFSAAATLELMSQWAEISRGICFISPWDSTVENECLLLSHLCHSAAKHAFSQVLKNSSEDHPLLSKKIPPSQYSWYLNQMLLSEIPTNSKEDEKLLNFLEKRWLTKTNGFFSSFVNWVCPCFEIDVQVHPETTSSYARDPWTKCSQAYTNGVEDWKKSLPHPKDFPLILTRPSNLQDYLPSCIEVPKLEKIQTTVERLALKMQESSKVAVDLTYIFSDEIKNQKDWIKTWESYRIPFFQACKDHNLNLNEILCIQRLKQEEIGGIRLLPLNEEETDPHYQFLLEWISHSGLCANLVELDRYPISTNTFKKNRTKTLPIESHSKENFSSLLDSFDQNKFSSHAQKNLMVKGTVQLLKGLLFHLTEDKWNEIMKSPTKSSVVQLCFFKIKQRLQLLEQEDEKTLFFETISHIEQIHENISPLIEIFSPFSSEDFPTIYQNLLTFIPKDLKPLTSCGIHTCGMMSFTAIFKAVEKTLGKFPRVLYGENTYFECLDVAEKISNASVISDATEKDWKEVDLIVAQFNPVLQRTNISEYRVENIQKALHKALNAREAKPLTLDLDCTVDFIDSPRVAFLLNEFQEDIEKGILNIVCFRSGLKFDVFGMDNYSGSPFYMIHSSDPKWEAFDSLSKDAVLQSDRLSLNWFCLAYKYASPYLELYRKHIFDNTRSILSKIPSRLFNNKSKYRIIPIEQRADPAFIDIKVSGSFNQIRGAVLVGGNLYTRCMEEGHPIFYRRSLGFYHPNFGIIFGEENSTIRLTVGLDPSQVDLFVECFEIIDALNGAPSKKLLDKLENLLATHSL